MNKSDLIKALAKNTGSTHKDARFIIETAFDSIAEALKRGDRVEIRDFGVFYTKQRKTRISRNPRTGESVSVPKTALIRFKAGKRLKEKVV